MDAIRTYQASWSAATTGAALREEGLRAGVQRRVVLYLGLNKRYDHLAHHCFVFSRDAEEEFDFDLQAGRAGAGPDLLPGGAIRQRPERGAGARGEALYVLVHNALPSPTARLDPGCSPAVPAGDPGQAQAYRRNGLTSRSGS